MTTKPAPKNIGEFIARDLADPGNQKMLVAIEADRRQRAENERLHPLKDYPYAPMRHSINPTA